MYESFDFLSKMTGKLRNQHSWQPQNTVRNRKEVAYEISLDPVQLISPDPATSPMNMLLTYTMELRIEVFQLFLC